MQTRPTYTQQEADELLSQVKYVKTDADPEYLINARDKRKMAVPAITDDEAMAYEIEISRCNETEEYTFLLKGQIGDRPMEGIASYHLHDSPHDNPAWFPPPTIDSAVPHVHTYNERAVREQLKWSKCAAPLPDKFRDHKELWYKFLKDMKVKFTDQHTRNTALNWGLKS